MTSTATQTPSDTITFNNQELVQHAMAGVIRRIKGITANRTPGHGYNNENAWTIDIENGFAEAAVAKYLGIYWSVGTFRGDDVGQYQVRWTRHENGSLILYREDPSDRAFILVTGLCPVYRVRGWIYAREGKNEQWWMAKTPGRPAFFIPQTALRHMSDLPRYTKDAL